MPGSKTKVLINPYVSLKLNLMNEKNIIHDSIQYILTKISKGNQMEDAEILLS